MDWGLGMGITGVAVAIGFAPVVSAVVGIIYVQSGKWKKAKTDIMRQEQPA